jgi:hypothetical protein
MKSIHQRQAAVESRLQTGHWQGDLIMAAYQRSAIATLVERKTRLTLLVRLPGDHSAQAVGNALIEVFAGTPAPMCQALTWDRGNEMFHHQRIESATGLRLPRLQERADRHLLLISQVAGIRLPFAHDQLNPRPTARHRYISNITTSSDDELRKLTNRPEQGG